METTEMSVRENEPNIQKNNTKFQNLKERLDIVDGSKAEEVLNYDEQQIVDNMREIFEEYNGKTAFLQNKLSFLWPMV